jgi:spoIIIJ-associated protein
MHRFIRDDRLDLDPLIAELDRFLALVVRASRLDLRYEIRRVLPAEGEPADHGPEVLVAFRGPDEDLLLARNAELLTSIEYIAHRWLHLPPQFHEQVRLDCADFRALRLEELRLSAKVAAQRVRETRQPFRLNPMSSRERRIVHLALQDAPGVRTSSEGTGDHRQVVIYPADTK